MNVLQESFNGFFHFIGLFPVRGVDSGLISFFSTDNLTPVLKFSDSLRRKGFIKAVAMKSTDLRKFAIKITQRKELIYHKKHS